MAAGRRGSQAPEPTYMPNGAVFVVDIAVFRQNKTFYPVGAAPFVMPAERSIDVDTETDLAMAEAARKFGTEVPFMRPRELATDTATSEDVLIHALDSIGEDFALAVLLQPTSPLCLGEDIDAAVEACVAAKAPACVSVCIPSKPLAWLMTKNAAGHLRRVFGAGGGQVPEPAYMPNGAVLVVDVAAFRRGKTFYPVGAVPFVMPAERSIDVDTEADLAMADGLLRRRLNP